MRRFARPAALAAALLAGLTACADLATAPGAGVPARPSLEVVSPSVLAAGLVRDVPLPHDIVFSFVAQNGGSGSSVEVPGTGLKIDVPNGALPKGTKSMIITVTAKAGDMVAYDFQPHGTRFVKPIALRQDVKGTNYVRLENKSAVEAGYFASPTQLDEAANTAIIDEFLPAVADAHGTNIYFDVHHFSGYMLSSGRTR